MGKMKDVAIGIMEMAEKLGDPYGFENETADYIASEFQISCNEVQAILDMAVPQEYTNQTADLDTKYYRSI